MYKTHITADSSSIHKNSKALLLIIRSLRKEKVKILEDWITRELNPKTRVTRPKSILFAKSRQAIDKSDFVIAECSYPSSSVGANLEHALSKQIPVLCLHLGEREKYVGSVIRGFKSPILKITAYSPDNVSRIISEFIDSQAKRRIKYSVFLNPKQAKYLEWLLSKKKEGNGSKKGFKSGIIREMINKAMNKDTDYHNSS